MSLNLESLTGRVTGRTKSEEGCVLKPYKDSKGLLTIGYGWCLDRSPMRLSEAEFRLANDVTQSIAECIRYIPAFSDLDEVRQSVLVDMTYQMGIHGVLAFHKMIGAVAVGDWETAAMELLDSKYAREDAPARAARNAELLRRGEDGA